jgi:glutamyl-tRNA synthetase
VNGFGWEAVGATAGVFNPEKMLWVNHTWIMRLPVPELARRALPYFRAAGLPAEDDARLAAIVRVGQERSKTLVDLATQFRYFYEPVRLDPKAKEKFLTADTRPVLQAVRDGLAGMAAPDAASVEKLFHDLAAARGLGLGKVAQPVRVALTGGTASPSIYDVVLILGREEALARLDAAIHLAG